MAVGALGDLRTVGEVVELAGLQLDAAYRGDVAHEGLHCEAAEALAGGAPKKVIVIKNRLVNIVV